MHKHVSWIGRRSPTGGNTSSPYTGSNEHILSKENINKNHILLEMSRVFLIYMFFFRFIFVLWNIVVLVVVYWGHFARSDGGFEAQKLDQKSYFLRVLCSVCELVYTKILEGRESWSLNGTRMVRRSSNPDGASQ